MTTFFKKVCFNIKLEKITFLMPYRKRVGLERVTLGRSGFLVTRIGIASGFGADEAMVEEAVADS